ncbi:hypothetical protein THIOSC15_2050020 [uncultured Thiomicrorhabdus sp.]
MSNNKSTIDFGYSEVPLDEKVKRVKGVFDWFRQLRHYERRHVDGRRNLEASNHRFKRRASGA